MKQKLFFVIAFYADEHIYAYLSNREGYDSTVLDDPNTRVFKEAREAEETIGCWDGDTVMKVIRVHRDNLDIAAIPE